MSIFWIAVSYLLGSIPTGFIIGKFSGKNVLEVGWKKTSGSNVYKNVGNQSEAEDITQEVFVKIWKNIKKFDQNRSFKPWIFQIAKNTSIDFLRKKKSIPFSKFENEEGGNPAECRPRNRNRPGSPFRLPFQQSPGRRGP